MKKIGFIDYYLDEWHANNYPNLIKERSSGEFEVCYAYAVIDSPLGGMTSKEWAEKYCVTLLDSIEEVVEKSDVLVVLSPDNPEMHEKLTDLPLKSGKPVYIDKTFAPDKGAAEHIFQHADRYGTKCFSSSALRFASELQDIDKSKICKIYSEGPGFYDNYSIHQIEPIMMLMNCRARRIMALDTEEHPSVIIEFEDKRLAQIHQCASSDFRITTVDKENNQQKYIITSDFFALFIDAMIDFFRTGKVPVSHEQTIDVIAIRESGILALKNPFRWIDL